MANIEFIEQYMDPVYISATNMVSPITTIKFENAFIFFKWIVSISNIVLNILKIGIQTTAFITKEVFVEAFTNLTLEKIVYIIGVYNLFMLLAIDNQNRKIREQKEQIERLEKNVIYLKKTEIIYEDLNEIWLQDIKTYHQETNNKITAMEKKIKKFEKDLKMYE